MSNTISFSAGNAVPDDRGDARATTAARDAMTTSNAKVDAKVEALLPRMRTHADVAGVSRADLPRLAAEIRSQIISVVCENGGHLGSNFGAVELTIALHYVYDFAKDVLVMDVGHQCYPHKLLTGRADRFHTLRTKGGISGYPHPEESVTDVMRSGHAGASISMALGITASDAVAGRDRSVVCMIGDSSLGSGVALEGLNYADHMGKDILVVLNDNEMSISKTVGSLAAYLNRVRSAPIYTGAKDRIHALLRSIPSVGEKLDKGLVDMVDVLKSAIAPGHLFEELGFRYYGPIDGHDTEGLIDQLERLKKVNGVKLLHVVTKKGRGLEPTGKDIRFLHGVSPGTVLPGFGPAAAAPDSVAPAAVQAAPKKQSFTGVFGAAVIRAAERDPRVVAITAAMPEGTGLIEYAERFPDRFHDTGITEQHAVAFAAGLAKGGARPIAAIYSTFLQRAYDQVFHEVIFQDLPVVFAMDRGGLVGQDGPSHHGLYDIAYLRTYPHLIVASPKDATELEAMLTLALSQDHPFAFRYPRGNCASPEAGFSPLEVGRGEVLREGADVALVGYGPMVYTCLEAADLLLTDGVDAAVINPRFVKPLDVELMREYAEKCSVLVTVEEHALMGGFGSAVLEALSEHGALAGKVMPIAIPDRLIEHASREENLEDAGLTARQIAERTLQRFRAGR